MNSEKIKNLYPNEYRDFFNKYDLVISAPIIFTLVGDSSVFSKWNCSAIYQRIPLRNYIWINFSEKDDNIEFYFRDSWDFSHWSFHNYYNLDFKLLNNIGLWYKVWFLSEYNWADPPSIIVCILLAKLLFKWTISIWDLEKIDITHKDHMKIIDEFISLDKYLLKNNYFFWNFRNSFHFIGSTILKSNSHLMALENQNEIEYISLWEQYDYNQLDLTVSIINPHLNTKNIYNPKVLLDSNKEINNFVLELIWPKWRKYWADLIWWIESINNFYLFEIFKDLKFLYENNHLWYKFFNDFQSYRQFLKILFNNKLNQIDIESLSCSLHDIIKDSSFDFTLDHMWNVWYTKIVSFSRKSENINEDSISELSRKLNLNLTLDYSSYFDWFETQGIKLEQYRSKWYYSEFSSEYLLTIIRWYEKQIITWEYEDLIEGLDNGMVLDVVENKIILFWKKLTSNDLFSQKATIELLCMLLEEPGKKISNKMLLASSYAKSKNEMIWKIIIPLKKLLQSKYWKPFDVEIVWWLTEFTLKMEKIDMPIYIVSKLD